MPLTPISCSASFTSSSLNGLMIASTFFTSATPASAAPQHSAGRRSRKREAASRNGAHRALYGEQGAALLGQRVFRRLDELGSIRSRLESEAKDAQTRHPSRQHAHAERC